MDSGMRCSGHLGGRKPFHHPTAGHQEPPDRDFDLRHIRLELSFEHQGGALSGRTTQTFAPLSAGVSRLVLHAEEMTIESVSGEHDKPLAFDHAGGRLAIDLPRAYAENEPFEVTITYRARPRTGLWFVGPDEGYPAKPRQIWSQGEQEDTRYWLPTWDYPNDRCTSEILATVPAGWSALSNGRLVEVREEGGGRRTFHWSQEQDHVPYLITLVAGEFDIQEQKGPGGVELSFWVPKGRAAEIERAMGKTAAMVEFFEGWTGIKYPWAKYAQAVVHDFTFGGMENTSATTLTERCLHDQRATPDFSADGLVMHELAHQWFGDLVTCHGWHHVWLNEGFATLSEILWREHALGQDEGDFNRLEKADRYFTEDRDSYRRPIVEKRWNESGELFDRHTYEKASLVLHMLRQLLGEAGFRRGTRAYLERHRLGLVETYDLKRALEQATGRALDAFFERWLYRAGHPELVVESRWRESTRLLELCVRQTQAAQDGLTPGFRLALRIRLWNAEGFQDHAVEITEADQTFVFPAERRPLAVTIDPGNHVLKTLSFERPVEDLEVELRRAPLAVDRALAVRALGALAHPRATALLAEALQSDPFWGVRREAARALGKSRAEGAFEVLVKGLGDADSRVRCGAAEGLGELKDARAAEALRRMLATDPGDYPRAEAARSLALLGGEGVVDDLARALAQDSHQDVIRHKALDGLAESADKAGLPLAREWSLYGKPPRAREFAIKALGKIGGDDRSLREHLESLAAKDRYIWARRAAIEALGELGQAKAIATLERSQRAEVDSRLKRAAREAIEKLRAKPSDSEALRREMESLRDANRRLESRIESLRVEVEERK